MIGAPLPDDEKERLQQLRDLHILDTLEERVYDDLTFLAAQICDTPIALVSLVDQDRQWFKSRHGLAARETPRDVAFCAHAIHGREIFTVNDAEQDARFIDNPLVTAAPHVKFYAGAPLILHNNLCMGTLCVIDDHARQLSPQQAQALQALSRQVVDQLEMRLRIQELEQLESLKDNFISMVSHELRTPLTSIHGALQLLQHQAVTKADPRSNQMVDIAARNTVRLLGIVNDILDTAKLDAGKLELDLQHCELQTTLAEAVELNQAYCEKTATRLRLRIEAVDEPCLVLADRARLLQVLANLISNAAKFTLSGDTIELGLERTANRYRISVTDHGPGIEAEQLPELFERFSQDAGRGNQKLPGTGLGLSISRQLIELQNGRLEVDSIPHECTVFYFDLPAVESA